MKETKNVVAAVIVHNGKIFAAERGQGSYRDYWEFPGGKIEPGEMAEEALIREIHEELDTEIHIASLLDTIDMDYADFHLHMLCFLCGIVKGKLSLSEHEDAKWLNRNELMQVNWLPADQIIAARLQNHWYENE